MPIVLPGTFDPYVMYRSVYFFIFAFSGQKITCWHVHKFFVNCEFLP